MAKKPTKKSQDALAKRVLKSAAKGKASGGHTAKLYKEWCHNDRSMRKKQATKKKAT